MPFQNYYDNADRRRNFFLGLGITATAALSFSPIRAGVSRGIAGLLQGAGRVLGRATPPPRIFSVASELEGLLGREALGTSRFAAPEINRMVRQELSAMAERGPVGNWIARNFGIRAVTLGEATELGDVALHAKGARNYFQSLTQGMAEADRAAFGSTIESLPVGGLYNVGGQVYDLRRLGDFGRRVSNFFANEFQIPLIPGYEGVSPGQLFPWWRGRPPQTFAQINAATRGVMGELNPNLDPVLNSFISPLQESLRAELPGVSEDYLNNWKVLKIGSRFAATWEGTVADVEGNLRNYIVRDLPVQGELRSALHGLMRNRTEQVLAAEEARRAGGGGFLNWLGLGRQYGHSQLQESLSFFTKFKSDSRWAPRVLTRLLQGGISDTAAIGHDLRRTSRFLTSRGLPKAVEQRLISEAEGIVGGTFPEIIQAARTGTDQGIFDFFTGVRQWEDTQQARRIWKSESLRNLYNEFRTSPEGFLQRMKPHQARNIGERLIGGRATQTGFDLTRQAIIDELEEVVAGQGASDTGFIDLIGGIGKLSSAEREAALGYATGKRISRRLAGFEGSATSNMAWEARRNLQAVETLNWLRGSAESRKAASAFTQRFTSPLDFYPYEAEHSLGASNLILPKGASFLTEFNKAKESGASFLQAFWQTVRGPWGRQYGSFFTGNAADFTERTLELEYYPRKLNQLFAGVGLGLPAQDLSSGWSIFQGLFTKRIGPAVAAYELYRYSDYKLHSAGLAGPSDVYAGARSRIGLVRARTFGKGGLFERLIGRRELFPGLEQWVSDRDEADELEFQESGYEPVRKGRFWSFGSRSPWQGEKIDYFLPSAVRVARSRWQETDTSDLNTRDYWAHSFIPLPENQFLGPLKWLTDRYWWENKHRRDRPYLISGEIFDPTTLHGTFLNPLLGWLKPRRLLHPEAVPTSLGGNASQDDIRRMNEAMKLGLDKLGVDTIAGGGGPIGGGAGRMYGAPGVIGAGGGTAGLGSILNISAGGMLTAEAIPGGIGAGDLSEMGTSSIQRPGHGERLSRREIRRINRLTEAGLGGGTPIRASTLTRLATQTEPFSDQDLDLIDYQNGFITGLKNIQDVMGLYGWFSRLVANPKQTGPVIESPNRAYGFNRRFYELGLGGLGGELSEVGRRFMRRGDRHTYFNPILNDMPSWLPGPEYGIVDFRHGDPYTKIPRGEIRLPGAAYERTHDVSLLQTRASSLGKSVPEIMQEMLSLDQPLSAYGEEVTEIGTFLHKKLQRRWKRMGVLEAAELPLYDPKLGISGHLDAILRLNGERQVAEIKTVGSKRFQQAERRPFEEHLDQLNFYLYETKLKHGVVLYVNRDDPTQTKIHQVGFDSGRLQRTIHRVEAARQGLLNMADQGLISRGDLYSPVNRFEILSDVAPYSANYAQLREYLTAQNRQGQLSEEENARFQAAKKRVAQYKRRVQIYPYRFNSVDLDYQTVTVDKILDPNTFTIRESDNPVRLAGLRSSQDRILEAFGEAPEGSTLAEHQFAQFGIRPGSRVRVAFEGDPTRRVADDVLKTQHAVVFARGQNINMRLIQLGVGTEKETDYSSTGVSARFSPGEIRRGRMWELFAHSDTIFHNKFLRVRSPLEELERGIVYGTNVGSWNNPIAGYIWPTMASFAARHPVQAGLGAGVFASFFFRSRQAKALATGVGVAGGLLMSLGRMAEEAFTGEAWKPSWTRRREELEEYWDVLKYVKYRGLAAQYEEQARREEGVDVEKIARDFYEQGESRKKKRNWLEKQKRELIKKGREENSEEIARIQDELDILSQPIGAMKLGPLATQALAYREAFRATLYGIDPGTSPFVNLFRAFPKYKRELITPFIEKSSGEEREKIFRLLPRQEQRVLGQYLGIDESRVPDRPKLADYFREHPLPDPSWAGWRPDVDLEALRVRAVRGERLDPLQSGLYNEQIDEAERETHDIKVPTLRGSSSDLRENLNTLLSGHGLQQVNVSVDIQPHEAEHDDLQVYIQVRQRREQEIRDALQLYNG